MKYINEEPDIPKIDVEEVWFNKDGKEISGENEKFYAKVISSPHFRY